MVRSLAVHPGTATLTAGRPSGWCSHLASSTTETNSGLLQTRFFCIISTPNIQRLRSRLIHLVSGAQRHWLCPMAINITIGESVKLTEARFGLSDLRYAAVYLSVWL